MRPTLRLPTAYFRGPPARPPPPKSTPALARLTSPYCFLRRRRESPHGSSCDGGDDDGGARLCSRQRQPTTIQSLGSFSPITSAGQGRDSVDGVCACSFNFPVRHFVRREGSGSLKPPWELPFSFGGGVRRRNHFPKGFDLRPDCMSQMGLEKCW